VDGPNVIFLGNMQENPFYLVIAGNIGVGKTTLTQIIEEKLGWTPYYEKVIENPYLALFYQNMERWGFHSQIFFLTHRFKAHLEFQNASSPIVQDRSIFEDAEVFAENLYQQGLMQKQDYTTYRDLYEAIVQSIRSPDLILYLKASPWTLLNRIRKRWRDVERNIDKEYLFQLNLRYEYWIRKIESEIRVLVVETDQKDFVENIEWRDEVLATILEYYRSHLKTDQY